MLRKKPAPLSEAERIRLIRKKQVEHIFNSLPPKNELLVLGDPQKLPLASLLGATEHFVDGNFGDAVLNAVFSVEMALLLKLDNKLEPSEKEDIRKKNSRGGAFSFGKMVKVAKEKGILKTEDTEKIWILGNLRNMFAHPANWVAFIMRQGDPNVFDSMITSDWKKRLAETGSKMSDEEHKAIRKAYEQLETKVNSALGRIPSLDWAAYQDTLIFQQKRLHNYFERMAKDLNSPVFLEDFLKQARVGKAYELVKSRYPYEQEVALEALNIAFETIGKYVTA